MTILAWLIASRLGRAVSAAVAVCAVVGGAYLWGRHSAQQAAEIERLRQQIETRDRIDDAIADPRTPADILERLRRLAQ